MNVVDSTYLDRNISMNLINFKLDVCMYIIYMVVVGDDLIICIYMILCISEYMVGMKKKESFFFFYLYSFLFFYWFVF